MPARGIQHVDLAVSDVERSLAFYASLLGPLGLRDEERYPTYRGTEEVVYVSFGDEWLGLRPADGGAHRYYGVGLEHLAFEVDSPEEVDAAHERCVRRGDRIHHPPEEDRDIPGYYAFFVFDPDGLRIEVFTPGPRWSARIHRSGETAILAGGCFWGVQELLRRREGVIATRVGYTGGHGEDPTEDDPRGHAEAVEVVFDPERVGYRELLELFFQIHDPTTQDRQGDETGSHVRSEIFSTSGEQRRVAEETVADIDASGLWPGKVVTRISEAGRFWEAPAEDQDYLQRHPEGETCHFPRPGWKLPRRQPARSR